MNWKYRRILALVLLLSMAVGLAAPATTAGAEQEQTGSLTISLSRDAIDKYLDAESGNQVGMSIYKVASPYMENRWKMEKGFESFGIAEAEIALRGGNDAKMQSVLEDSDFQKAALNALDNPFRTVRVNVGKDSQITFSFSDLPSGIYYAVLTAGENNHLLVQSSMVAIPYRYLNSEQYAVRVDAKVQENYKFPLTAVKLMAGRKFYEGDEFTFKVESTDGAPLPEKTEVKITPKTGEEKAVIDFGNILFTRRDAGKTYQYIVTEQVTKADKERFDSQYVTPDYSQQIVTVQVEENEEGKLLITSSTGNTPLEFVNTYKFNASIPLTAFKELVGRDFMEGDQWTFIVLPKENDAPRLKDSKVAEEAKNARPVTITPTDGRLETVNLGYLHFDEKNIDKTYHYDISESGEVAGVTNDKTKTIQVVVTYNPQTHKIEVVSSSGDQTANAPLLTDAEMQAKTENVTFKNVYNATKRITFKGKKTVENLNLLDRALEPREFSFVIKEGDEVIGTAYNDEDGNIIYPTINYTLADVGVHTYKISEVQDVSDDAIQTDKTVHTVRLKVSDSEKHDGTLEVRPATNDWYTHPYQLDFVNKVKTGNLLVRKILKTPTANETFKFIVELNRDGKPVNGTFEIDTIKNETVIETGEVTFTDGKAEFSLQGNQSKEIKGIPVDTVYKVTEEMSDGQQKLYALSEIKDDTGTVDLTAAAASGTIDTTGSVARFTNERLVGDLTLVKKLEGAVDGDTEKEFTFTVDMADKDTVIKGENIVFVKEDGSEEQYAAADFSKDSQFKGSVTIRTKAGVPVKIKGLPTDVEYKVTEKQQPNFELASKVNDTGTITQDGITATFTNKRLVGDLTLVKKLEDGADVDADKEFTFTVDIADKDTLIKGENIVFVKEDGSEEQYTAANFNKDDNYMGSVTVRTKAGVPVKIKGLPTDVKYTVTEEEQPYFELASKVNDTGTITQDGVTATFTNKRTVKPVSLTVTKTVQGATNDTTSFNFTVTLGDWNGGKITGEFGDMTFTDGVANFALMHGEMKTATGLPSGIRYTVVEEDNTDYSTTVTINEVLKGTNTASGTINAETRADHTVAFTNNKVVPKTPTNPGGNVPGVPARRPTPANTTPPPKATEEPEVEATPTPEPEKITVSGRKTWDDNDNAAGKRPGSITIHLFADSSSALEEVASKVVTVADGWSWTFTNLPAVDSYNLPIDYSIKEDPVDGYTVTYKGYDVTNSMKGEPTPELITVEGNKTWDDQDNAAGKRPDSITIHLFADSSEGLEEVASKVVTAADGWSWTFTDLPAVDSYNLPIEYSIKEDPVAGYTTTYSGYNVTNSMKAENTSATIIKIWDDASDPTHLMRPKTLKATLYGNGAVISTVTLNAGNGWSATVDDLPAYQSGERITYTWKEEQALGYVQTSAQTDGTVTTITNTLWQLVPPPDNINPGPRPGTPEDEIDDYGTPLGLGIIINHVGDCFD